MNLELYLLRHAPAEERDTARFNDDSLRPLTPEGIERMRQLARGMRALRLEFDMILSSPFKRARQTAEIVAAEFKRRRQLKFTGHLAPGSDVGRLIGHLATLDRRVRRLLLVGHEPDLGRLAGLLVAGRRTTGFKLKKGGVLKLTARSLREGACAELEWVLTPKLLVRLGR